MIKKNDIELSYNDDKIGVGIKFERIRRITGCLQVARNS